MSPTIYLRKDLYDAIVKNRRDPNTFVNDLVAKAVAELHGQVRQIEKEGAKGKGDKTEG